MRKSKLELIDDITGRLRPIADDLVQRYGDVVGFSMTNAPYEMFRFEPTNQRACRLEFFDGGGWIQIESVGSVDIIPTREGFESAVELIDAVVAGRIQIFPRGVVVVTLGGGERRALKSWSWPKETHRVPPPRSEGAEFEFEAWA